MARSYYRGNSRRLKAIDSFDQQYRAVDVLRWCMSEPFPSPLLHGALFSCQAEQLDPFQFLISEVLRFFQKKPTSRGKQELYRGMKLEKQLVDYFKFYNNKMVCVSGFFSCDKLRPTALQTALSPGFRPDLLPVLFKIECDLSLNIVHGESILVFEPGTTFRILCVSGETPTVIKLRAVPEDAKRFVREYKDAHPGNRYLCY